MVEKGHFEELQNLLELINADEEKKKKRQTFVFSATLTLIHELPKHMRNNKKATNMTTEEKLQQVSNCCHVSCASLLFMEHSLNEKWRGK